MANSDADVDGLAFARRIHELRRASGLTQRQVAEKLGIDFTYLSKLENNRGEPPGELTIRKLARLLKTDEEGLLALAGKIPTELRQMAVKDLDFATFLRQLPSLPEDVRQKMYRAARKPTGRKGP